MRCTFAAAFRFSLIGNTGVEPCITICQKLPSDEESLDGGCSPGVDVLSSDSAGSAHETVYAACTTGTATSSPPSYCLNCGQAAGQERIYSTIRE